MKTEWWYDDATFHYTGRSELALARLTVRDDGTAQLLTAGETFEFENEEGASVWLTDEEYRRLEDLIEDLKEDGIPVDPRIKVAAASEEDPARQMVIKLTSAPALGEERRAHP